jgi:hypothetical protein
MELLGNFKQGVVGVDTLLFEQEKRISMLIIK